MFDRKQLISESKDLIRRGGGKVLRAVLVYLIIALILSFLMMRLEGYNKIEQQYRGVMTATQQVDVSDPAAVQEYYDTYAKMPLVLPQVSWGARLIVFVLAIVLSMVEIGYKWWSLKASRGLIDEPRSIFDVFSNFARALLLILLRGIIVTAGLLLFIVPGVYLALSYSQAEYILLENPDLGAGDCLRRSRELMRGHLGEYFLLSLSFIGWILLVAFGAGMVSATAFMAGLSLFTTELILSCIGMIWLTPYMEFTFAGYYNYLTNYTPEEPDQEVAE
jgi:uncharacterized membrane protein